MKRRDTRPHADCPVRYRARGQTLCGATDTPCVYCADAGTRYALPSFLSGARRRKPRDTRRNRDRNTPPFEDS